MTQSIPDLDPGDRSPLGLLRTAQLIAQLLRDGRVSPWLKLIVPATLLYLFFPLDVIPDMLFGPGQLDDLGIILFGLWLFLRLAPTAIVREYTGGRANVEKPVDVTYRVVDEEPPAPAEVRALPSPNREAPGAPPP